MLLIECESIILDQVKFLNYILEEIRRRNKDLGGRLEMSYAKLVGIASPYEEAIASLRKVKNEFDNYLNIIRSEMIKELTRHGRTEAPKVAPE
jgi:hypothetical protein